METPAAFLGVEVHVHMCVCVYIDRRCIHLDQLIDWSLNQLNKGKWSKNIQDEYCRKMFGNCIQWIKISFALGFQITKLQIGGHYLLGFILFEVLH